MSQITIEIDFACKLIKGRIAEVIFEQMIRKEGRYEIIPFGYEHTIPTLAQYHDLPFIKRIIENIKDAPDFALISNDKREVYLVEVKYRSHLDSEDLKIHAEKLLKRWDYPWLFVATPKGFYCDQCKLIKESGEINLLSTSWVIQERQSAYLELLNKFEK